MNIGLDIDGVLYPWQKAAYAYLQEQNLVLPDYSEIWKNPHATISEEKLKFIASLPFLYNRIIIDRDIVNSIVKLHNAGHSIYYITCRPKCVTSATEKFISQNGFPQDMNLIICDEKPSHIRRLEIDIYVEDQLKHIRSIHGLCRLFCIEQPWNLDFKEELKELGVEYRKDIHDFVNKFLESS